MKKKKIFLQSMVVFGITLTLLWLFMILSASIPNRLLKENMTKSAITIMQTDGFAYCEGDKMNGIADNYADSIWINVSWYMGEDNPFFSSVNTKYYDGEEAGVRIGLYRAVNGENQKANTDYTRYWHGTAGIIRFLHLFTDVNGIRNIGFILSLGLAAFTMILLIRGGKDSTAIAFFLSLCMVKIWNIRLSMEYQPAFILCFLMCILYLLFEKRGDIYLVFLSVVNGTLIAFFDFLTTETMVILLPVILVVTIRGLENRLETFKKSVSEVVLQGTIWTGAYGLTIFFKWCFASIITGSNKFALAITMAGERVSGNNPGTNEWNPILQRMAAPAANLSMLFGGSKRLDMNTIIMGVLLVLLFYLLSFLCLKFGKRETRVATQLLTILGSVIWVRYFVLNNHSYVHAFFTYRGMISMFMAMFSIVIVNTKHLYSKKQITM